MCGGNARSIGSVRAARTQAPRPSSAGTRSCGGSPASRVRADIRSRNPRTAAPGGRAPPTQYAWLALDRPTPRAGPA